MMSKVIIIGAGIGGLALANLLARDGHDVHVYEAGDKPGGRAGKRVQDGFTFDTGPSWYLMPEVFERYYEALGESVDAQLDIVRLDPSYKVFFEHEPPVKITGTLTADAETFEAIEPGSGAALRSYAEKATELYDLSLRYFLYTDFSNPLTLLKIDILRRLPKMLSLMLTPIHSYVARFVRSPRLQQILEYPMVFLGSSPYEAPALYSLMGALDFTDGVYYPRGGMYTIVESLASIGKRQGVSYRYNAEVAAITSKSGRATGIRLASGEVIHADIVVSNADLHYTETALLAPEDQSYPERYWHTKQPACSALLLYLGVSGSVPELEHHNLLFVDAWKENFDALYDSKMIPDKASLYLSRTSATDPDVAPKDHETLFVLVPLPATSDLSGSDAEKLAAHYISQIESMTGVSLRDRIVTQSLFTPSDFGSVFHSWQNSMLGPSHVLRQSAFWRTKQKSKRLANLYYVGAGTLPGIGLPMCLISAQVLADRIKKDNR